MFPQVFSFKQVNGKQVYLNPCSILSIEERTDWPGTNGQKWTIITCYAAHSATTCYVAQEPVELLTARWNEALCNAEAFKRLIESLKDLLPE